MELTAMYEEFGISKQVLEFASGIESALQERFKEIDDRAEYNQLKVLNAMQKQDRKSVV